MNTLRKNLFYLLGLKGFQIYLPIVFLVILSSCLLFFTLKTGPLQVLNQLGLSV